MTVQFSATWAVAKAAMRPMIIVDAFILNLEIVYKRVTVCYEVS